MKTRAERSAAVKKWCHDNPERHAENVRRWKERNPGRHAAYAKRWHAKNPTAVYEWQHNDKKKNPAKYLLRITKGRASRLGLKFELTHDWITKKLTAGKCEQTGIGFRLFDSVKHPFSPSIDRKNPKEGYTIKNCQMVCAMYNLAKNAWSDSDVWKMMRSATVKDDPEDLL